MDIRTTSAGVTALCLVILLGVVPTVMATADSTEQVTVPSSANVFAAGREEPPDLELGAGTVPPSVPVAGADTLTVQTDTGTIDAGGSAWPKTGPDGYNQSEVPDPGGTNITSYDGVAGITHERRSFFLVGVFLTNETPSAPAPDRLDVTGDGSETRMSPAVGQVFYIGDGRTEEGTVQVIEIPAEATRLYLGFADAPLFHGKPGAYADNTGKLSVTVDLMSAGTATTTTDGDEGSDISAPGFGVGAALVALVVAGLVFGRLR